MPAPLRWKDMRGPETPLERMVESFFTHRSDLSEATIRNYRVAFNSYERWCERELGRSATVGDIEPGTVEAYLKHRKLSVSAETARVGWVALRSIAEYFAQLRIHGDGESVLRHVRMPRVKENHRRNLTDAEMWKVIECSSEGEQGPSPSVARRVSAT